MYAVAAAVRWLFQRLVLCTVSKVWWGQCRHGTIKKVLVCASGGMKRPIHVQW